MRKIFHNSENKQFRKSKCKERWSPGIDFTNVAVRQERVIVDMPGTAQRVPLIGTVGTGIGRPESLPLNVLLTAGACLNCAADVLHLLHCIEGLVNAAQQLLVQTLALFVVSVSGGGGDGQQTHS